MLWRPKTHDPITIGGILKRDMISTKTDKSKMREELLALIGFMSTFITKLEKKTRVKEKEDYDFEFCKWHNG